MVISTHEALKLIGLYNDYLNDKGKAYNNKNDIWLYVYGFFGEQCRFQNNYFFEECAREKYILEKISKYPNEIGCNIDFETEFLQETSFSTDVYSANLYAIFALFFFKSNVISKEDVVAYCANFQINYKNILRIIEINSISIEDIRYHTVFLIFPMI